MTWNVNSIKQRILEIEDLPTEKDHTKIIFVDRQGARHNRNNFRICIKVNIVMPPPRADRTILLKKADGSLLFLRGVGRRIRKDY